MSVQVLLLFVMVLSAHGESSCKKVDLSGGLGHAWNQADSSWCHAYTLADGLTRRLLDLKILNPGERIHPLRLAASIPLLRNTPPNRARNWTSTPIDDLDAAYDSEFLLCKESDLGPETDESNALFQESYAVAQKMMAHHAPPKGCACDAKPRFARPVADIENAVLKSESDVWSNTFRKKCNTPWPSGKNSFWFSNQRVADIQNGKKPRSDELFEGRLLIRIEKALASKSLAAVGYDPSFLMKNKADVDSHWSSIVGREPDDEGRCYYVLRNSWGPDCTPYDPKYRCKDGVLKVPAEEMVRSMHSFQTLETPIFPAKGTTTM